MRRRILCLLAVLMLLFSMASVSAYGYSYETEHFDVNVQVEENHVFHVRETISVNFSQQQHGIFRYIPYEPGIYTIKNVQVEGYKYETSKEMNNGIYQTIVQIGNGDEYVTGRQKYVITYDLVAYQDKTSSQDFFSMDLLPTEWETPIRKSVMTVTMPKDIDPDAIQIFSGYYGTNWNSGNIRFRYDADTYTITLKTENLYGGMGVTMNMDLPEGYWVGAENMDWVLNLILGLFVAVPVIAAILWFLFGRDPKIVKTVEFYPPEGMTPAEIGYIIDGKVDANDIISLMIYFAEKGYISIKECEDGDFELSKLKPIGEEEKNFVKTFFHAIFEQSDTVSLRHLPADFGEMYLTVISMLKDYYTGERRLYTRKSFVSRMIGAVLMLLPVVGGYLLSVLMSFAYIFAAGVVILLLFLLPGEYLLLRTFDKKDFYRKGKLILMFTLSMGLIIVGTLISAAGSTVLTETALTGVAMIASTLVTLLFVVLMKARTKQSAVWQGKILGFRDFIEKAELEKLKLLAEENPSYFYHIMPYAYVMGLSDVWAKNFETIPTHAPDWYSGYQGRDFVFTTYWYSRMMRNCTDSFYTSTIKSIAANSSDVGGSGSSGFGSGFGGGGFSGGGFGGGGGGAW